MCCSRPPQPSWRPWLENGSFWKRTASSPSEHSSSHTSYKDPSKCVTEHIETCAWAISISYLILCKFLSVPCSLQKYVREQILLAVAVIVKRGSLDKSINCKSIFHEVSQLISSGNPTVVRLLYHMDQSCESLHCSAVKL